MTMPDEIPSPHEACPDCGTYFFDTRSEAFRNVAFLQIEEGCDHCTPLKETILSALRTLRKGTADA